MSVSHFVQAILLMLFIYWGWDSAVSVNEETADKEKTPGRAAVISTVLLVAIYTVVAIAVVGFAGVGSTGDGLTNPDNSSDVISTLGTAAFGAHGAGLFFSKLLVLMVLTSAAASTQTTILPTARTSLAMAAYKAIPRAFARIHPRFLTPSVSTLAMGGVSIVLYLVFNYVAAGNIIADSVTALGWMIAFYYGLTGFECVWYYRGDLRNSARDLWVKGIIPLVGASPPVRVPRSTTSGSTGTRCRATRVVDAVLTPLGHRRRVHHRRRCRSSSGLVLMGISIPIFRPFFRGEVMSPEPELAAHLKND